MNIQWYPGHMTKTRRQMAEYIKQVDAVCEVVDARIPQVSRNPDMDEIAAGKPRLMILNRIDLADPKMTSEWAKHFRAQGMAVIDGGHYGLEHIFISSMEAYLKEHLGDAIEIRQADPAWPAVLL